MVCIILQGGDNMLGRAVQLTLPYQTVDESDITDSMSAQEYLDMTPLLYPLNKVRQLNHDGSYLWATY